MSEIETEQQWADQVQMERELEEAFKDIEDGIFLTDRQIDLLRYACGLPPKPAPHPALKSLFEEFGTIFGAKK
jgi:hypothetical protein